MAGCRRSSIAEATDLNGASPSSEPSGEDDAGGASNNLKVRRAQLLSVEEGPLLPSSTCSGFAELIAHVMAQWLAPLAVVGGIALLAGAGIVYKEDIKSLLHAFIRVVDRCGAVRDPSTQPSVPLSLSARIWTSHNPTG